VLVDHAQVVLAGADHFAAMAVATREGIEPELTVAIDPLVQTTAFIDSLQALRVVSPDLPVSFSTEGLGGAKRRLRRGDAALAFCTLLPSVPEDVAALPLLDVDLIPVVAPIRPLARLDRYATRGPGRARPAGLVRSVRARRSKLRRHEHKGLALCRAWTTAGLPLGRLWMVPHARGSRGAATGRRAPRCVTDRG
jgi:hypothetical protein